MTKHTSIKLIDIIEVTNFDPWETFRIYKCTSCNYDGIGNDNDVKYCPKCGKTIINPPVESDDVKAKKCPKCNSTDFSALVHLKKITCVCSECKHNWNSKRK